VKAISSARSSRGGPSRRRSGSKARSCLLRFSKHFGETRSTRSRSPPRMAAFCPPEELLRPGDLKALAGGLLGTAPPGDPWGASHGAQTGWVISFEQHTTSARRTPHRRRPSTARAPDTRRGQLKRLHHPPEACIWGRGNLACRNRWRAGGNQSGRTTAQPRGALAYPTLGQHRGRTHDIRHEARPGTSARSARINAVDDVVYIIGSRLDRQYPASPEHRRADAHGPE
jgi:hypothetical protein